jgi:hypothetical protein
MFIRKWNRAIISFLLFAPIAMLGIANLKAATIEVEDDDISTPPTPISASPTSKINPSHTQNELPSSADLSHQPRVRVNELTGFYYFVKAGFVVPDDSKINSIGRIVGDVESQISYSTGKRSYIDLTSSKLTLSPGDLLVVYRDTERMEEPVSGFSGVLVQNLAFVRVIETHKNQCLVEVKETFAPFQEGDKVKVYDDEIKRWKQAQIKKNLPDYPVKCYVAGGENHRESWSQTDFIVLTAGTKKGVVEGQIFQLREFKERGWEGDPLHEPEGKAQVFYAGPNYSMAQIFSSREPVKKGFEALYQP